ncbi:MAG: hypothetical protein HY282_05205 [Nitrospirae bacterium]|nr:hypothetical protein [Candidatus Manganitrophaceae bacterium]
MHPKRRYKWTSREEKLIIVYLIEIVLTVILLNWYIHSGNDFRLFRLLEGLYRTNQLDAKDNTISKNKSGEADLISSKNKPQFAAGQP